MIEQKHLDLTAPSSTSIGQHDDLIVSPCNAEALSWVNTWPHWPQLAGTIKGLILIGPAGCGKSLLASMLVKRAGKHILLLDNLDLSLAKAASSHHQQSFEADLLNQFENARAAGTDLIITARKPISDCLIERDDLTSRFLVLPQAVIEPPDRDLLRRLMVKLATDRGLFPPSHVIDYLVPRIDPSFAAAKDIITALDHAVLMQGRKASRRLAADLLAEGPRSSSQ